MVYWHRLVLGANFPTAATTGNNSPTSVQQGVLWKPHFSPSYFLLVETIDQHCPNNK